MPDVLRATYALDFQDRGLANAVSLDKQMRDSVQQTQARLAAANQAALRSAGALNSMSDLRVAKLRQETTAWVEAGRAGAAASRLVAAEQQKQATLVTSSIDKQVAKLRGAHFSYSEIVKVMSDYRLSAAQVSAAVQRSAREEVGALEKVVSVRNKLRQMVGLEATSTGRRDGLSLRDRQEGRGLERGVLAGVSQRLRSGAGYVTGGLAGGLLGYLSVSGIKNAIDTTTRLSKSVSFLTNVTGLSQQQAASWAVVAQSNDVSMTQLAQTFRQLGNGATAAMKKTSAGVSSTAKSMDHLSARSAAALGGSKTAALAFEKLGITQDQVAARQNNVAAIYALVVKQLNKMPAGVEKTAVANELLGSQTTKAAKASSLAVQAFKDLGITQDEIRTHSANMSDMLGLVADRLKAMPPGLQKTRDEAALLGRGYMGLNLLLAGGSKGMEEARKKAEAYGITLGGNATQNAQKLEEAQVNLRMASLGLQVQFAEHLAPTLIDVTGFVLKTAVAIGHTLHPVMKGIVDTAKDVAHWFGENKVALDALIGVAGTVGGFVVLSKTLQMVGRVSRGVKSDWETLKTSYGVVSDVLFGKTAKVAEEMNRTQTQEEILTEQTKILADVQNTLAAAFGRVDVAATAATRAMAGASAASPAAAALATEQTLAAEASGVSTAAAGVPAARAAAGTASTSLATAATDVAALNPLGAAAKTAEGKTGLLAGLRSNVAEKGLIGGMFGREGLSVLRSGLGQAVTKGGGALMGGLIGNQMGGMAGGLVGGKRGASWGSALGTGAGIGMAFGPEGAIAGAVAAAAIKILPGLLSGLTSPTWGQEHASKIFSHGFGGAQAGDLSARVAKSLDTLRGFESSTSVRAVGRGGVQRVEMQLDFNKLTGDRKIKAMKAANAAGQLVSQQLEAGWNQYKFQSEPMMFVQLKSQLANLPGPARAAAVKSAVEFAKGLESQGRLAKGSAGQLLQAVEERFNGFQQYLHLSANASMVTFNKAMDFSKAEQGVKSSLGLVSQHFVDVQQVVANTSGTIEAKTSAALGALQLLGRGTGPAAAQARADIKALRASATSDFAAMTATVSSSMADQKQAIITGSDTAVATAESSFGTYSQKISDAMASGVLAVKSGNRMMAEALNAILKAFGASPLPKSVLRQDNAAALTGYYNFATQGAAGGGSGVGHRFAVGGWVPGDPTRDGTLALLSGNEFVVTGHGQAMMEAHAPGLLSEIASRQMPHFQNGGPVNASLNATIKPPGVAGRGAVAAEVRAALKMGADAANQKLQQAMGSFGAAPGSSGGNAANEALGRQMMLAYGGGKWGPGQWPYLKALWTQESGWNASAVNPSSGAYGIPQSLGHGNVYPLGAPRPQIAWGLNYIEGRYGSPAAAEAHERAFNWYRKGGFVRGYQAGGFVSDITGPVPGWQSTDPSAHPHHTLDPNRVREYKVPGTGVHGIPARYEYVSRATHDAQVAAYQRLHGSGRSGADPNAVKRHRVPGTGVGGVVARYEYVKQSVYDAQLAAYQRRHLKSQVRYRIASGGLDKTDAFFAGFENALDPTMGLSAAAALALADPGASLRRVGSPAGAAGGGGGGSAKGSLMRNMLAVANQIKGRPYIYGGGRPPGTGHRGYDCSSAVSTVINVGGRGVLPPVPSGWSTDQLKTWGLPGNGRDITVGVWGSAGGQAHTMMDFFGNYFESGGKPGLGPHFDTGWSQDFPIRRHPPGYRRGGRVGDPNIADLGVSVPRRAIQRFRRGGYRTAGGTAAHGYIPPRLPSRTVSPHLGAVRPVLRAPGHQRGVTHRIPITLHASPIPSALDMTPEPTVLGSSMPGLAGSMDDVTGMLPTPVVTMGAARTVKRTVHEIKSSLGALESTSNNHLVRGALASLSAAINDTQKTSYGTLVKTASEIKREMSHLKDNRQGQREKQRLTQALKLVERAEGARVGALVAGAINEQTAINQSQTALTNMMTRKGISATSAKGTKMMADYQDRVVAVLEDSIKKLQEAYKAAQKAGNNKAMKSIGGELTTALQALDSATATAVQNRVAAIEAAAQEPVDATSNAVSSIQGQIGMNVTAAQASGADRTVAGGQKLAQGYQFEAGAIQGQIGALTNQQQAASSVGDTTLANQIAQSIQQAQASYQQAELDALNAIKTGVEGQAQSAVDAATHNVTMATTAEQGFELKQQLSGASGTAAGNQALGAYITQNIVPALQAQLGALQAQKDAANSVGDTVLATQIAEQIAQSQNGILQAQLDAQNAIKAATEATAKDLGNLSGATGFDYQSQPFTDTLAISVGA